MQTLQQKHLQSLIDRYTKRTQTSKLLAQKYRPVLADNRASDGFRFPVKEMFYPIVASRSLGSRIWDVDDNEYIDISMGFGINLFGHNPPFIKQALLEQCDRGLQLGPQSDLAGEVAELISELTGMERVAFSNTGTEAVMSALRLARAATGRHKIALFSNSYHGHFDGTLATHQAPGILPNTIADVLVLDYGHPQSLEIIQTRRDELAAVLVEPVQSRNLDLQPKEFLQQLRQLTLESGIALIFDEMVSGFRIHQGGAQAWFGIQADIATYGKIVGGGMPIGIIAGKAAYLDKIDGGFWNYGDESFPQVKTTVFAGTFCKHPLAVAAAKAVLEYLKSQGNSLQQQLNQRAEQLISTLNAYFKENAVPIWLINFGSQFRPDASMDIDPLLFHLLEKGIYLGEGRSCFLSTAHSDRDCDRIIQAVKDSIQEMREGGFFPVHSPSFPETVSLSHK